MMLIVFTQCFCSQVITRGPTGLRGFLYGYVEAFDKHWNMVLTEVLEVYQRKAIKKLKIPPAGGEWLKNRVFSNSRRFPSVNKGLRASLKHVALFYNWN